MQDLTHDAATGAKAYLVPSSMQAGNTTAANPELAMTAPGSQSVLPVPEVLDVLPMPRASDGQIPLSHPGRQERAPVQSAREGGGSWADAHTVPAPSRWKETS